VAERLAADDLQRILSLLGSPSAPVATGAARLVGRLGATAAATGLARLLERPEPAVRIAAVGALQELRVSSAAGALARVLDDAEREVRIAAARALGALRYTPVRGQLEALIQSKRIREADITERLAFFEAYGSVAGPDGVTLLDRLLNGRSWLGRREAPEIRASAAVGLGHIDGAAARGALATAVNDPEMVVRTAVARALRREDA
jgi:HEAT repeat protein